MPTDERIGFDSPQSLAPREHVAQSRHNPARGVIGPACFDLPFLKQRQLFAEKQILGRECTARPQADGDKVSEIK